MRSLPGRSLRRDFVWWGVRPNRVVSVVEGIGMIGYAFTPPTKGRSDCDFAQRQRNFGVNNRKEAHGEHPLGLQKLLRRTEVDCWSVSKM